MQSEAYGLYYIYRSIRAAFHRIQGCHAIDNPASGKVMEKAGMVREAGPLRHWYYSDIIGYLDSYARAFSDTWPDSDR